MMTYLDGSVSSMIVLPAELRLKIEPAAQATVTWLHDDRDAIMDWHLRYRQYWRRWAPVASLEVGEQTEDAKCSALHQF